MWHADAAAAAVENQNPLSPNTAAPVLSTQLFLNPAERMKSCKAGANPPAVWIRHDHPFHPNGPESTALPMLHLQFIASSLPLVSGGYYTVVPPVLSSVEAPATARQQPLPPPFPVASDDLSQRAH
jgi:hypothetical protein